MRTNSKGNPNPEKEDWERYAQRLTAANATGFRIEQYNGHRRIYCDNESDNVPVQLMHMMGSNHKHYGSFSSALDKIDEWRKEAGLDSLYDHFWQAVDHHDDLGVIFGEGIQ